MNFANIARRWAIASAAPFAMLLAFRVASPLLVSSNAEEVGLVCVGRVGSGLWSIYALLTLPWSLVFTDWRSLHLLVASSATWGALFAGLASFRAWRRERLERLAGA